MKSVLTLSFILITFALSHPALSQGNSGPPAAPPKKQAHFEVVSIHESGNNTGFGFMSNADGFMATHQTVFSLILSAYYPFALWSSDRIQGCPNTACSQEYDVTAKVAPEDLSQWNSRQRGDLLKEMLQNLLADRFKLTVHTIASEQTGFALVVGKKGSKLTPTPADEQFPKKWMDLSHGGTAVYLNAGDKVWAFYDTPMVSLVDFLEHGSHTLIEDRTGLRGNYDLTLSRQPDGVNVDRGDIVNPDERWNLDLLGLEIKAVKLMTTKMIVDHVEKPSPN